MRRKPCKTTCHEPSKIIKTQAWILPTPTIKKHVNFIVAEREKQFRLLLTTILTGERRVQCKMLFKYKRLISFGWWLFCSFSGEKSPWESCHVFAEREKAFKVMRLWTRPSSQAMQVGWSKRYSSSSGQNRNMFRA